MVKPSVCVVLVALKPVKLQGFMLEQVGVPQLPEAPGDHAEDGHQHQQAQQQE